MTDEPRQDRWHLLVLLCLPTMSILLSTNAPMTALAAIAKTFPDTSNLAVWVLLSYTITAASLSMLAGDLGDRYGLRRLYSFGLAIFLLGSLGASLADRSELLVLSRIVSGAGSAILAPVALAFLNRLFSGSEKPIAFGFWSASVTIGVVIGPMLGGWMQTLGSWRLIFPAAALPAVIALIMLHRLPTFLPDQTPAPMDVKGITGLAVLPFLTLFTVTEIGNLQLGTIVALLILIVSTSVWTWRHLVRCPYPAIPIGRLYNAIWWRPSLLQLIIRCIFIAMLTLLTTYFHNLEGESEYLAAKALIPFCLAVGVASLSSGLMCKVLGARTVLIIVFVLAILGLSSLLSLTVSGFRLQDWIAIIAIGLLVGNTAQLSRLSMSSFSPSESMRGAALNTMIINLGISLGAALPSLCRSLFSSNAGLGQELNATQLVQVLHADIMILLLLSALGVWHVLRLSKDQGASSPATANP